jgi:hypothetical protein
VKAAAPHRSAGEDWRRGPDQAIHTHTIKINNTNNHNANAPESALALT